MSNSVPSRYDSLDYLVAATARDDARRRSWALYRHSGHEVERSGMTTRAGRDRAVRPHATPEVSPDVSVRVPPQPRPGNVRFDEFMIHAPVGAWIKDRHHRYVWANPLHLRHLGRADLADVVGRTAAELDAPWHTEDSDAEDDRVLASGEPLLVRGDYLLAGSKRSQQGHVFVLRPIASETDLDQQSVEEPLLAGVFTDVTELEEARDSAATSTALFDMFMSHAPAAAYLKDDEGRHLWANRAYLDHYGLRELGDLVGRTTLDIDGLDVALVNNAEDALVHNSASPRRIQTTGEHGQPAATGFRFTVPLGDDVNGLGGIWVDTTELHRTREELSRWRDHYRALFDHSPVPMSIFTIAGARTTVMDANPAFCQLLATRLSAVRGIELSQLLDPDDTLEHRRVLGELLTGPRRSVRMSTLFLREGRPHVRATVTFIVVPRVGEGDGITVMGVVQPDTSSGDGGSVEVGEHSPQRRVVLSAVEARVLQLRAAGASNPAAAEQLGMTRRGIDYHLGQIARKLRCANNTTLLIARAYHLGVLDPHRWPPTVPSWHRETGTQQDHGDVAV